MSAQSAPPAVSTARRSRSNSQCACARDVDTSCIGPRGDPGGAASRHLSSESKKAARAEILGYGKRRHCASLLILAASDTTKSQSTLQVVENPAGGLSDL